MKKRVVLALGGNALQKNGETTAEAQKAVAAEVGELIANLDDRYEIIVAHGNGPQVGNILIHAFCNPPNFNLLGKNKSSKRFFFELIF